MNIKAKITPVALAIALAAGFGLPAAVQPASRQKITQSPETK